MQNIAPLNPAARDEAANRILAGEQSAQQPGPAGDVDGGTTAPPASPAIPVEPRPEWPGQAATILRAVLRLVARGFVGTRFKFLRSVGRGIDREAAGAAEGASAPLGLVLGFKFPSALPWVAIGAGVINSALDSHPLPPEPSPEQEAADKRKRETATSLDPLNPLNSGSR